MTPPKKQKTPSVTAALLPFDPLTTPALAGESSPRTDEEASGNNTSASAVSPKPRPTAEPSASIPHRTSHPVIEGLQAADNIPTYSVSDLRRAIATHFGDRFGFLRLHGEVTEVRRTISGHLFFKLRDDQATISCAVWRGRQLDTPIENGTIIAVEGSLIVGRYSDYRIDVVRVRLAGIGALLQRIELLRQQLKAEGLFDPQRKQPLPRTPECLAVITSPAGAVLHDIWQRMIHRFPVTIQLWPTSVQTESTVPQIVQALSLINALPQHRQTEHSLQIPDVIIIARGGGGAEELLPFSAEPLLRAVAASTLPVVTAIGHETDHPLVDEVADLAVPTPTASIESILPSRKTLMTTVRHTQQRMIRSVIRITRTAEQRLSPLHQRSRHQMRSHGRRSRDRWLAVSQRLQHRPAQLQLRYANRLALATRQLQSWTRPERTRQHLRILSQRLRQQRQRAIQPKSRDWHQIVHRLRLVQKHWIDKIASRRLPFLSADSVIEHRRNQLIEQEIPLQESFQAIIAGHSITLDRIGTVLHSLGPRNTLKRGFIWAQDTNGNLIASASDARKHETFRLVFVDGEVFVRTASRSGNPNQTVRSKEPH